MTTTVAHLVVLLLTVAFPAAPAPAPPSGRTQQAPAAGVWPLQPPPAVVAGFDPPLSPYGAGHRGVDLAGRAGQVVHAAAGGRVTFAGSLAGRGVVVVAHGGTRTTYEPVRATVGVSTTVDAGDRLGTLEPAGSHCAPDPCLHWGLLEGETYLDPLTLVGGGPVRLLPFDGPGGPLPARSARLPASPVVGAPAAPLTWAHSVAAPSGRTRYWSRPPGPARVV